MGSESRIHEKLQHWRCRINDILPAFSENGKT